MVKIYLNVLDFEDSLKMKQIFVFFFFIEKIKKTKLYTVLAITERPVTDRGGGSNYLCVI